LCPDKIAEFLLFFIEPPPPPFFEDFLDQMTVVSLANVTHYTVSGIVFDLSHHDSVKFTTFFNILAVFLKLVIEVISIFLRKMDLFSINF
jgi:hypothetical protein